MNDDQYSALLATIVPGVVGLIAVRQGIDEPAAARRFYSSALYAKLADEELVFEEIDRHIARAS